MNDPWDAKIPSSSKSSAGKRPQQDEPGRPARADLSATGDRAQTALADSDVANPHAGTTIQIRLPEGLVPRRLAGFTLYNAWLLSVFYNTFIYVNATDMRGSLYLSMLVSMVALVITMALLPRIQRADKRVLSKRLTIGPGVAMALATLMLGLADLAGPLDSVVFWLGAALTGVSSGILFLGWCRLYADAPPRTAITEMSLAWIGGAALDALLSVIWPPVALALVSAAAIASAVLLRTSAFMRPARPVPSREHQLQPRTRRMFIRGLTTCLGVGLVAGFSDVLAGFRYVPVPDRYELYLAASVALAALLVLATARVSRQEYMVNVRRAVFILLVLGSLLTLFVDRVPAISNIVLFGAYQCGFVIFVSAVCIDVSNYFDKPATKVFGWAFFALYLGETLGNALAHITVLGLGVAIVDLSTITFVLSMVIVVATLFLFTERDLIETSLGDMTVQDLTDEQISAYASVRPALSSTGEDADDKPAEQRRKDIEEVAAQLCEQFGLTAREAQVLPLLLRGRTIARIQDELGISRSTVATHIKHIYQKAGVNDRQALLDMVEDER